MKTIILKYLNMFDDCVCGLEKYAPAVLRIGMAMIMLWFSAQQFLNPQYWTAYVPQYVVSLSGIDALYLVYMNAGFELIFGLLLTFGILTRISALLLSLHLFHIVIVVGYNETGIRDLGLAIATLVVFMNGTDILCLWKQDTIQNV